MYMAAEWASATKAGKPLIYTNDKGQRVRAVMLDRSMSFNLARYLPMRLSNPRQIAHFLREVVASGVDLRPGGVYEFHTTFKGSIGEGRSGGDFLTIKPGDRVALSVDKKGLTRIGNALRATQRRLIEETVAKDIAAGGEPFNLRRISQHPDYIAVSKEEGRGERGNTYRRLFLKADSDEKLVRAIEVISKGAGLELYLNPQSPAGAIARRIIEESYVEEIQSARLKFEQANPESAERLRQIEAEALAAKLERDAAADQALVEQVLGVQDEEGAAQTERLAA